MKTPSQRHTLFILAGLFAVALALRLPDLTADPPNHFAGLGQALLTDPYHCVHFARNQVLYGQWDVFDYDRWVAFKVTLVSGLSWVLFTLLGVSRYTANLTAVTLNTLAIGALVAGIIKAARVRSVADERSTGFCASAGAGAIIAAALLITSHILTVYGRAPFLENGALLLAALTFYTTVAHGKTAAGAIVAGSLVALCVLAGKLYAGLIAAPVFALLWTNGPGAGKRLLSALAGGLALTAVWYATLLGDSAGAYHSFLFERSVSLQGSSPAFESPAGFLWRTISFGAEARLFHFHLFLPALFVGALLITLRNHLLVSIESARGYIREHPAEAFLLIWSLVAAAGLTPFSYRPLRYLLFFVFPALGFVGLALGRTLFGSEVKQRNLRGAGLWLYWLSAALGAWFVVAQFRLGLLGDQLTLSIIEDLVWSSAPVALLAVAALLGLSRLLRATVRSRLPGWILLALCALAISYQGVWHARALTGATHEAQRFSSELSAALSADAALVGPYATNFTMDNHHQCLIYFFGVDKKEQQLFQRFPITHIAADQPNLDLCQKQFPLSRAAVEVARLDIRESSAKVVRLNRPGSTRAPLTALERAAFFAADSLNDSALASTQRYQLDHPQSALAARKELERLLVAGGDREAVDCARRLVALDSAGAWSHALAARGLTYLSMKYRDRALQSEAENNLRRAIELNPAATEFFTRFAHMQ